MISLVTLTGVIFFILFVASIMSLIFESGKLVIACFIMWVIFISISATITHHDINRWQYGNDYIIKKLNSEINALLEKVEDKRYELQKEMKRVND